MRRLSALVLLPFAVLGLTVRDAAHADEASSADPATAVFVEWATSRTAVYTHERVRLDLRIGYVPAHFARHAAPLFRQPIDVSIQVDPGGTARVPGLVARPPDDAATATRSFVFSERVVTAPIEGTIDRGGRTFEVLRLSWWYDAGDGPDRVEIPAPSLRYAYAERIDEDFLGGRVAVGRREIHVRGRALTLEVLPLPEDGRPEGFADAVGRFDLRSSLQVLPAAKDVLLRLELVIEGEGNLATLTPPGADSLPGFRIQGTRDEVLPRSRLLRYDIAPDDARVAVVPPLALPYFDPTPPGTYAVARTTAHAIPGRTLPEGPADGPGFLVLALAGVGTVLLAAAATFALWRRRRRAHEAALAPAAVRAESAARALAARRLRPGPDLEHALVEYLAARLECEPAAIIAPDLATRLVQAGADASLAGRTAALLERFVEARYGSGRPEHDADDTARLVDEWTGVPLAPPGR